MKYLITTALLFSLALGACRSTLDESPVAQPDGGTAAFVPDATWEVHTTLGAGTDNPGNAVSPNGRAAVETLTRKTIDRRNRTDANGNYYLLFCAIPATSGIVFTKQFPYIQRGNFSLGHAFVQFVREDFRPGFTHQEIWGMWAQASTPRAALTVLGRFSVMDYQNAVDIQLRKDLKSSQALIQNQLIVRVNEAQYNAAYRVYQQYANVSATTNNRQYNLISSDCLTFLTSVASGSTVLKVPSRSIFNTPMAYVQGLITAN